MERQKRFSMHLESHSVKNRVCAVIVTFRPQAEVLENLSRLRPQVGAMVVIDNGSAEDSLSPLRKASLVLDFVLIENGENLGLPAALNVGLDKAQRLGFPWLCLFDQDSRVTEGFIAALVSTYLGHPAPHSVGLVAARYIDAKTGKPVSRRTPYLPDGSLEAAMTSGSLLPAAVFRQYGGFEEPLTIDMLDHEYSLRLRSHGLTIIESETAVLLHAPGFPRTYYLGGVRLFRALNHSPARQYYRVRNRVWIAQRYGQRFPGLRLQSLALQIRECIIIILAEKARGQKLWLTLRGVKDGLLGHMGKTIEL
jgi:rhamnosyltransferase